MSSSAPELNERAQHLLKMLVERYIQDGQPVGSRALSRESGLRLSPATIRNVMSDLEDLGLVMSPHTSAGRIPTVTGYRLFVDSLLTVRPLQGDVINRLRQNLNLPEGSPELLGAASRMLSDLTQMAGVVTLPRREVISFRHIEFLPLSQDRVLVILVTNEQEVHNKIIYPAQSFTQVELQAAANYLNSIFEGKDLSAVRQSVLQDMQDAQQAMNHEMMQAISMANLAFGDSDNSGEKEDYVLSGETNLMDFSDLSDMERLRKLFNAFSQKRNILHLLDRCLEADGVQIFIGEESGYQPLDSCSLVTASYSVDESRVGVLGVIGPTRMAYERIIPLVDVTAKLLGAALNQKTSSP